MAYALRRIVWSIPVLFIVSLATFVLMHIAGGGPWDCAISNKFLAPATKQAIMRQFGLDRPMPVQYVEYISAALRGDLGPSYCDPRTVNRIISDSFPVSAAFGLAALMVGLGVGILAGLYLALHHNSQVDHIIIAILAVGTAIPSFVVGIALIVILCINLHLFSIAFECDDWRTWVLPLVLLSIRTVTLVVRFTRAAALEVMHEDYIRTARMKGLPEGLIIRRHILRNALLPVLTLIGPLAADLLTGVFIVESFFSIPGLGYTFVTSITKRDYPLLMGVTLFFSVILIACNLLVDISYTVIDPRMAHQ